MPAGNVSIQSAGGASTYGVIASSGSGLSFLNPLYKYANLTLPYNPNDPGLQYTFYNIGLSPSLFLYARFFNLLNETSQPVVVNAGTSVFIPPGGGGAAISGIQGCLDVRNFGAKGDGVTDDTAAIQAALNQAYQNTLSNTVAAGGTPVQSVQLIQSGTGHVENGSSSSLTISLPTTATLGNTLVVTFTTFNYGGGPGSPATPTVGDAYSGVWQQAQPPAQNGEFLLWTFYAAVPAAQLIKLTINVGGRQYNSFISAVFSEYSGVLQPFQLDGVSVSTGNGTNVTKPLLAATNQPDLVVYGYLNAQAAGVVPNPPSDFTLAGAQQNPQPNGLNGAVPVTAQAYKVSDGTASVSADWSNARGILACSSIVAFRLVTQSVPTTGPGRTTVCIPSGVNCLVNPVALDEGNLTKKTCRYGPAAYSLLINDGVTLEIEGSIIANPNARATTLSPSLTGGNVGWYILMNKNWVTNSTIMTPLKPQFIQTNAVMDLATYNSGAASVTVSMPIQKDNDIAFYVSTAGARGGTTGLPGTTTDPFDSTFGAYHNDSGSLFAFSRLTKKSDIGSLWNITQTYGNSLAPSCAAILMSLIAPHDYTADWMKQGGDGFFPGNGTAFITPGITSVSWFAENIIRPGDVLMAVVVNSSASTLNPFTSVTDSMGNYWFKAVEVNNAGLYNTAGNFFYGCSISVFVCPNPIPKLVDDNRNVVVTAQASVPLLQDSNSGWVLFYVLALPGFASCGLPISWTDYIAGTALNEGVRNKHILVTGQGNVELKGNSQSGQTNGFYPMGLARFEAVDDSVIEMVHINNPNGCAIQWMNSTDGVINDVTIQNGANWTPPATAFFVQDPGAIEVDLWRSGSITNSFIKNCPVSRGILDWSGYQLLISSNTLDGNYSGYEYRDSAGETGYYFSVGPVQANSNISLNRVANNVSAPMVVGTNGESGGSNGFLFKGGFVKQGSLIPVTGISFHSNTLNGNSTDFSYTSNIAFQEQSNNSNAASSGQGSSGSGGTSAPVVDGQNLVSGEVPAGVIDGVNTIFTLAHTPISGTLAVFINGLGEFLNVDYAVNGTQLIFVVAPTVGSSLIVNYRYLSGT